MPDAPRPVLVAGRAGQLAVALAAAGGAGVVALGRPELDLTDPASLTRAIGSARPRAILNAAAYTAVDRAEAEPEAAYALNRDAPARLAAAAREAGVPFIHVSTDQVFDGGRAGAYAEDDAPNPLCVYGASKLAGEEAVAQANPAALIVRVSWVFAPVDGASFVARLLAWARAREVIQVVDDQRGRPTYAPELARALLDLAGRMEAGGEGAPRGLLHLAGAEVMTRDAQARAVMAASAARGGPTARVEPVPTSAFPTPARRPLNAELDVSRARARHGIALGAFAPALEETLDALLGPRG